jgi:hypothetical protein
VLRPPCHPFRDTPIRSHGRYASCQDSTRRGRGPPWTSTPVQIRLSRTVRQKRYRHKQAAMSYMDGLSGELVETNALVVLQESRLRAQEEAGTHLSGQGKVNPQRRFPHRLVGAIHMGHVGGVE